MTINGSPHVTGTTYMASLVVGDNPVTIAVISKEQRVMVYTVHITRLDSKANAHWLTVLLHLQRINWLRHSGYMCFGTRQDC
ncbi:hypothetical protein [Paenibacillus oryzisoli]|uniref:hypothetical protein n=1 Tax=Paenibacillus oryzisoli TaxID=1850517 RepID=UPI0012F92743